jgi:hypothetical protein
MHLEYPISLLASFSIGRNGSSTQGGEWDLLFYAILYYELIHNHSKSI